MIIIKITKKKSIAIMFVLVLGLKISMSHCTTQFIWRDVNQKSWQACTCWLLLWRRTTTCMQFFSFKMTANGIWSVRSCLNAGRTLLDMSKLRWLDTVFQGQYRPSLSINYVTINKVLEKLPPTVVLDKDENLLWSGLQWHRSCHSNEMTLLPILLTEVFLGTENCSSKIIHGSFFLQ